MTTHSATITIGHNLGVRLTSPGALPLFPREGKSKQFLGDGSVVLDLTVQRGPPPSFNDLQFLFDSGGLWKVFGKDGRYVFINQAPVFSQPLLVATVDFRAGRGEVYLNDATGLPIYPFEYPLDEVIFSKLLADRDSVIVHACGMSCNGIGILFPGFSGSGKSTLSSLFSRHPGVTILSDDRIAVGVRRDGVHISGTPWLGTAGFASPQTAPLHHVLFLQHDSANRVETMSAIDATTQLLGLSVLPYWDADSVEKSIEVAAHVIKQIPASRFGFVPDTSAVEFLLHAIDFTQR